jgi:neurotransmitter:Na+ symporter, NSS family
MANNENKWGSNLSFLLAMIGSAVGLGNIWRYPYVLYSNGGGAFFIPYIVAVLILGVPFLILEYGVGYNFRSSFPKAIRSISRKWEYLGWFLPVTIFMVLVYYISILGWDGFYVIISAFKGWGANPNNYFTHTFLQATESVSGFTTIVPIIAISILVCWFILWFISHKNLEDGIGKVSKALVPLLFIIMFGIVIFSLTLPGASIGLAELFHPDWSLLADFNIWMAAFGQIIFSLSLGMCIAFTYSSYAEDDSDLVTNVLYVALANCGFENFAAIGVFSILGYMSLQSGVAVTDLVTQGTGLVFIVYPEVFNVLGSIANIIGPLFFFTVFLAGITSVLALLEPVSVSIQNKFDWSRSKAVTFLCIIGAVASMIYATAMGSYILGIADTFLNQIALLIGVILECILFAWVFKTERIIPMLNKNSKSLKIGKWWVNLIKYIIPIVLGFVWVGGLFGVISSGSNVELAILFSLAIILLVVAFIFMKLPAKSDKWDEINQRF